MWVGEGPLSEVLSFAFAPDGSTLYTGDDNGCVRAWDRFTHEDTDLYELPAVQGRRRGIWQFAQTANGNRLFVPAGDCVHVLDLPAGTPAGRLPKTSSALPRADVSADGTRVAAVVSLGRFAMWDTATLEPIGVPGPLADAWDVTFATFVAGGTHVLTFGSPNWQVALWDVETGDRVGTVSEGELWCQAFARSPDGRTVATCARNGSDVHVYDLPDRALRTVVRHTHEVAGLAFHPDGRFLAVTDGTKYVTLWDTATTTMIQRWNWRIGEVRGVCFAPDGLTCAVGSVGRFAVFDVDL
jgi:WD40 repeat protein